MGSQAGHDTALEVLRTQMDDNDALGVLGDALIRERAAKHSARERADAAEAREALLREAGRRVLDIAEQEKLPSFACFQELEELLAAAPTATERPAGVEEVLAVHGFVSMSRAHCLALMEAGVRAGIIHGYDFARANVSTHGMCDLADSIAARVLAEWDAKHAEANND